MGKKSSSNKPSKAGQASRTANNKAKHKVLMTELYTKAHGSTEGMPDWDAKPNYTPKPKKKTLDKRQQFILDLLKGKKLPDKKQIAALRKSGFTWNPKTKTISEKAADIMEGRDV